MENEEIFLGADAIQVVKYHGSYQQVRGFNNGNGEGVDGVRVFVCGMCLFVCFLVSRAGASKAMEIVWCV